MMHAIKSPKGPHRSKKEIGRDEPMEVPARIADFIEMMRKACLRVRRNRRKLHPLEEDILDVHDDKLQAIEAALSGISRTGDVLNHCILAGAGHKVSGVKPEVYAEAIQLGTLKTQEAIVALLELYELYTRLPQRTSHEPVN